jgi:hypothetical protein
MDRTELANLCIKTYGWEAGKAHLLVNEFCDRFMPIKKHAKDYDATLISPSYLVDQVWHVALQFTKGYAALCEGPIIHHDPIGSEDNQNEFRKVRYQRTLSTYRSLFHDEPPVFIWPPEE